MNRSGDDRKDSDETRDLSRADETQEFDEAPKPPSGPDQDNEGDGFNDQTIVSSAGAATPDGQTVVSEDALAAPSRGVIEDEVPQRIGSYPILRELGRGGMGVVYIARDPGLDREVALKMLPPHTTGDPAVFTRFQGEAKLLASINNPNIATIYSLEEDEGRHFLTMELIKGPDLDERIKESEVPVDEWLSICRQIAVALEAAHRNGIVHLDLKPKNVMLTEEGVVKVLDFGLAVALGREADDSEEVRTRAKALETISGTPGYMSPEQLGGEAVDSRADIWAFGCILYECITRNYAIPGSSLEERVQATMEAEPDMTALPETTPPRMRDLLAQCLVRPVEKRLDTFTKVRREIEEEIALRALPKVAAKPEAIPNNLPVQVASFVGRAKQKSEAQDLLAENRLLTLTGVGGGGKTRLALEIGREALEKFPDGVWYVELGPVADHHMVAQTVASVLKLKDVANRTMLEVVTDHLEDKTALLILDNCERLLTPVAELSSALLASCPDLRVLATSREAMSVPGEVDYHVPSLRVPPTEAPRQLEDLRENEAVQLFLERASAVNPSFELTKENAPSIIQVCRRLDGIPLAIELAAARIKVLPAEQISKRLDHRFKLLTSSSRATLPHHQTLRALIDWSYDHLTETEQSLVRRLCLFAGGWTLDAAEVICAGDGIEDWEILDLLSHLVDKSLVETDAEGGQGTGMARYRMLETISEYARDKLIEHKEGPDILVRHRDYFLAMAEEADQQLQGPEQATYLVRLGADHDNLRLALDMCSSPEADPELGWRLGGALGRYFFIRGRWSEGRKVFSELFSRPEASFETAAAAHSLNWAGNLAKLQGDYAEARTRLEESLAIRRRLGEEAGIAASLNNLANVVRDQGHHDEARELYEESLALQRKLGNKPGMATALDCLGILAFRKGKFDDSHALHEESLTIRRELGDRWSIAASLNNMGTVAEALGDFDQATKHLEESLGILREFGDKWSTAASLINLGSLAEKRNDLAGARASYEEGLETFRELGDRRAIATALNNLGIVLIIEGDREQARGLLTESLSIFRELDDKSSIPSQLSSLARLAAEEDDPDRAVRLLGGAEALREEAGVPLAAPEEEKLAPLIKALEEKLGADRLKTSWKEGRELEAADAIAYALGEKKLPPSTSS